MSIFHFLIKILEFFVNFEGVQSKFLETLKLNRGNFGSLICFRKTDSRQTLLSLRLDFFHFDKIKNPSLVELCVLSDYYI
uniref:Ovule protein n=1 Tax=Meloidogyne incognita TaxID=6306 RepID=A0A914KWA4_MELIC